MTLPPHRLALALLPLLAGCQSAPSRPVAAPGTRAAATQSECRATVDRVFSAQNRAELSRRDERDTPFAASYNSGIVSRGLSARYQRDDMYSSCLDAAGAGGSGADTGAGPTFRPQSTAQ